MRGIDTTVHRIRRSVFAEVARMSYEYNTIEEYEQQVRTLPFKIIPGEANTHRESIFLERAIVSERIRLAMGLPLRPIDHQMSTTEGLENCVSAHKYYEPPLINVIKFACHRCPEKIVKVTEMCQGCLAHPCQEVCPKNAISFRNGNLSYIDQDLCIKCGRCVDACPYHAIIKTERPCAASCGMNAIHSDSLGRAEIDYDKCVSCGMCLVNCPFGAISDKSQIFQLIQAFKRGDRIYAAVAPAFINQFPGLTPGKFRAAMLQLGFEDVVEVAIGADLCTVEEAKDFLKEVPDEIPFMATSCCPAWSVMAKKLFPERANCVSMAMTPMVLTARMIKKADPDIRVCFVGPCAAKKLEAQRRTIRSDVSFVLTFEELMGMFQAKQVDFDQLEEDSEDKLEHASADGRGFAASGGVAQAVVNAIKELAPDREVKVASAQGLADCKKLLMLAKAGKYNGYLLEGMACPGGCIAGAGTLADPAKTLAQLNKYKTTAPFKGAVESPFEMNLAFLEEERHHN